MNRLSTIIVIVVIALVFTSCVTNPENNTLTIFGYWQLVESTGGFTGETRTPESLGYHETIYFTKDSLIFRYRENQLIGAEHFHLFPGRSKGVADTLAREDYYVRQIISYRTADTLVLTDYCTDCFRTVYARTQPIKIN